MKGMMMIAVLIVATLLAYGIRTAPNEPAPKHNHTTHICQEDESCWIWSKMGDRQRGVIDLRTGSMTVVDPCEFRKLWMDGNADLNSEPGNLRGDWWAIHNGCKGGN